MPSIPTTKKKIEEIDSQIRQCFSHDAEIKDDFKTYKVNKVFVIISGEISNEGRNRLGKELGGKTENVHGIRWLVENFTEHYPEVFFEGEATSFLQNRIKDLEETHVALKSQKLLSDTFIEPLVQSSEVSVTIKDTLEASWNQRRLPFSTLKSILKKHKPIILVGDPGTGKSACLTKLAIDLMKDALSLSLQSTGKDKGKSTIPILVNARKILEHETTDQLLVDYFQMEEIVRQFSVNILFVDGLDEVKVENRGTLITRAKLFAKELGSGLVITSRKVEIVAVTPLGFEKMEILPFGANQALALIEKINTKKGVLSVLKTGLDQMKNQIPMVPLSLLLLIDLVEEHGEIPASVTELYERYNDSVLGREDKNKGVEVLFEYLIKKRFLASLAFREFVKFNRTEISRDDFDWFLAAYGKEYRMDEMTMQKFVDEIERVGALQVCEEAVFFRHRSFQDYYAGFFIYDRRDEIENLNEFVVDKYFDDDAGETTFFYVGLRRALTPQLLDGIFDFGDSSSLTTNLYKAMSGHLLQAGWHSSTTVKLSGIRQTLESLDMSRENFYKMAVKEKWTQPKVMSDAYLLSVSDFSLKSGFLIAELEEVMAELKRSDRDEDIFKRIALLGALRTFTSLDKIREEIVPLLEKIEASAQLVAEDKVRFALLLGILDRGDGAAAKSLRRKIRKIYNHHPKEVFKLLPADKQRPKFRPPSRKRS